MDQTIPSSDDNAEIHKRKRDEFVGEFVHEPAKRPQHDFRAVNTELTGRSENNYEKMELDNAPLNQSVEGSQTSMEGEEAATTDDNIEEDEDISNEVLDENKFLCTSSSDFLTEGGGVNERICTSFESPIHLLQEGGFEEYLKYKNEHEETGNISLEEQQWMEQIVEDATIRGDPREYQQALFEVAKSRNTIINLGTGYGKTMIALLCIRHFSPSFQEGKQTLFLVPSVALAVQQSTTLKANLPAYSIQTACYANANSEASREALAKCNVIVATHGAVSILHLNRRKSNYSISNICQPLSCHARYSTC